MTTRKKKAEKQKSNLLSFSPDLQFSGKSGGVEILAAAEGSTPQFRLLAYDGGIIKQPFTALPIYVNLQGLKFERPNIPALLDHKSDKRVGHIEAHENEGKELVVMGPVSAATESAAEVIKSSKNNYPYQVSIGAKATKYTKVLTGQKRTVNGRHVVGPALIAETSILREVSFVGLGANTGTHALLASSQPEAKGMDNMDFNTYVEASGFVVADLTETQATALKKSFDEQNIKATADAKAVEDKKTADIKAAADAAAANLSVLPQEFQDQLKAASASLAAQARSIEVKGLLGNDEDLLAAATAGNWDNDRIKAELQLKAQTKELDEIKASSGLHSSFGIQSKAGSSELTSGAITAALCQSLNMTDEEIADPCYDMEAKDKRRFGDTSDLLCSEQEIDMARKHLKGMGLSNLVMETARSRGFKGMNICPEAIRAALSDNIVASGSPFSNVKMTLAFETVLQRILIRNYDLHGTIWQDFATSSSVRDFREVDHVRFGGLNAWNKISSDGKMTMGQMAGQETFTNSAETYAQINYISRQDMINDDLGIFNDIGTQMAFWGQMSPEILFNHYLADETYTDATNYFDTSTPLVNKITSNALGLAGLDAVYDLVSNRQDPLVGTNQKNSPQGASLSPFINTEMVKLLVPTGLFREISNLLGQAQLHHENDVASTGQLVPTNNFHFGKYSLTESKYLANASWSGANSSATSWYMFADPRVLSAIEFVFLNGVQRPTIEAQKVLEGDRLGVSIRGWFDLGINFRDRAAAVKCVA